MKIEENEFPYLFRVADAISLQSQKAYSRCVSADLLLIVLSGLVGAFSLEDHNYKVVAAFTSAFLMGGGIILTIYIRGRRFEQNWFDGRAIAESVKTSTWRFIVCSEPYGQRVKTR